MMLSKRRCLSHLLLLATVAAVACTDSNSPTDPRRLLPQQAGKDISDGAHVDVNGKVGNGDVFFLPPMVKNPSQVTGYGDPFQPGLPVTFSITDQTTTAVVKTLAAGVDLTNQSYAANWDTKSTIVDLSHIYRINVVINTKTVAYADVKFGINGASLKNIDTDDFVGLVDGRTLPIKVRIEKGWDCLDKSSCVTQVVPNTIPTGQTVIVSTGGTLPNSIEFSPSADGTWATNVDGTPIVGPIVVTIQDVSNVVTGGCGNGLNLELSQNHCVRITTDPAIKLKTRARVGTCLANLGDERQLLVKYDTDPLHQEAPRFLEDAPPPVPCESRTSSTMIHSSNPLVRFAATVTSGIGRGVNWALGVKPAFAFDAGGGGFIGIGDGFSLFAPAFPRRMLANSGDGQQAGVGSQLANDLVVQFTFVHDVGEDPVRADINGASLTCLALTKGSGFPIQPTGTSDGPTLSSSIPATPLGNGLYSCGRPFLAQDANQFKVTAAGLPDAVLFDVANDAILLPGSVTFTATGIAAGTIQGTVRDPSGAVLPAVSVTLSNASTEQSVSVLTNSSGKYTFQAVQPGGYFVRVNAPGFPSLTRGVQFSGGTATIDFDITSSNVTLQSVDLVSTDFPLDAGSSGLVSYTATVNNAGTPVNNVVIQGWIEQGTARRAAGGEVVRCPQQLDGVLPTGNCGFVWGASAQSGSGGSGTLSVGPASLVLELRIGDGATGTLLARRSFSINIVPFLTD